MESTCTLNDEQSTMEEAEYAELLGVSDERKLNMKMTKHEHVKQHPEEIAPFSSIQKKRYWRKHWNAPHSLEQSMDIFPCKSIMKAGIQSYKEAESMKTMQQIHGFPQ